MSKVKELRERNNEKQYEIAALINNSHANYSKKENGSLKFNLKEAKIIAEHYGDSIENIFFANEVSITET